LKIINPFFKIQNEDDNIFTMRKKDYEQILPTARQILQPAIDLGFQLNELALKDSRFSSGELAKTIKQTLTIKLQKATSNIDLSLHIPKLVDDNYIIINGRRKIPLFQLFDIPIVTRGDNIKLRTNVATLMLFKDREPPYVRISFLGKKVPLSTLMFAYFGIERVEQMFNLKNINLDDLNEEEMIDALVMECKMIYNEIQSDTQDDFIVEIGRIYSKYNAKSKGHDIVYALDLIPQVDIFTAKFLRRPTLLEELVYTMVSGEVDDTLFTNKRIRCFEYMIYSKLSKIVFDMCFSNRSTKNPKFNINTSQILTECNVSDIVQFDFSINPIEELTKLSRISLLGPGGFKRENIPKHLRDICPTMFGRICPVDTPDRDNCGVLQNLIPNVRVDENLRFTDEICEKQPISIPVSMVPFCEHDDQTRLQMSSSQMRQAILLKDFDQQMIKSGGESLYTNKTQFVKIAKKKGEVVHLDEKFLMVVYDDKTVDIFNVEARNIYVEHMDFMKVYVGVGDKFKAGEILAESNFVQNGEIVFGRNLLTGVMIYYGHNYEDGIIISDRLVKDDILASTHFKDLSFNVPPNKVLLSLSDSEYQPLPKPLDRIKQGNPYAIIKTLSGEDLYSVFTEINPLEAEKSFIIPSVKVYANEWNGDIPEYKEWVEKTIEAQKKKENSFRDIIKEKLPRDQAVKFIRENDLEIFSFTGKYKSKKEAINGIFIEMYGIHVRAIKVGDKIANRHGNKGVVSKILPHEMMPQLSDGRHLDICINPLGIISRMNIGQLFELHLSMSLYDLKQEATQMYLANKPQNKIKKYLVDYIKIIDKTEKNWYLNQFIEQLPEEIDLAFIDTLSIIQPSFESCGLEDLKKALEYTKTGFKYKVYDPVARKHLLNEIAAGYVYFFRMVHIAEEKLAARGIGSYAKRTLQPLGGRKNKGGQRCGEMETACIIGHDAPKNLFEFLTTKSDCIDMKNDYIRKCINPGLEGIEESKDLDPVPESVKLLNSYLTVMGVDHRGSSA
jgi:DNA-directed RNA polymerase beta subunit